MDSRQVGRHVFLFSKENGIEGTPTIVAKPVDVTKDLPREFLRYLKTLFDILDEKGAGFIRLADIETRWKTTHGSNGLWKAVIENLRKVASKNGLLSFETLCTGMKLALKTETCAVSNGGQLFGHPTKRSQSLPQLDVTSKDWTSDSSEDSLKQSQNRRDKTQIMNKLRDWKDDCRGKPRSLSVTIGGLTGSDNSPSGNPSMLRRSNSTTKVYFVGNERSPSAKSNGCVGPQSSSVQANYLDKELRFKELEDEVNTLQNGLQVIEKARKWYFKRITAIQEEKLHLQNEDQYSLEQFQYELLLHKTRRKELGLDKDSFKHQRFYIKNISGCLEHIIHGKSPSKDLPSAERKLLEEVELLKKEVSDKANKIAQLEGEKCALIRDLFNIETSGKNGFSATRENNFF